MQRDQPQMQHNRIVKRRRAPPAEREDELKHARQLPSEDSVTNTAGTFSPIQVTIPHTVEPSTTVTKYPTTSTTPTSSLTRLTTSATISEHTTSSTSTKDTPTSTPQPTSSDPSPTPSVPSTSISSTSTSVPASGAAASGSVSSGAIAGIVIAVLIAVLGVGLLLCFYRRRRGRQTKSPRWLQDMGSKLRPAQDSYQRTHSPAMREPRQTMPQLGPILVQPPVSYGNDSPMHTTYAQVPTSAEALTATVKLTFVPTLPDELSIMHGEQLQLLHDYDDGWALCVNSSGSQGMVPMECLQLSDESQGLESPRAITTERRASSLAGAGRY